MASHRDRARERPSRAAADLTGELPSFLRDEVGEVADRSPEVDADLVAALVDLGVDEENARAAVAANRVPLVLVQQVYGGDRPRYTLERLAAKSGVPEPVLHDVWIASGLPPRERYTRTHLRWARTLAELLEVLPPDAVIRSARARGSALAAIARADLGVVRDELVLPMRRAGADDLTVAIALAETARGLDDIARGLLLGMYRLQLEHQLSTELAASLTRDAAEEVDLAVGFVDVVGYTALSARIDPHELDTVLEAFAEHVVGTLADEPDVSVVKYLGDAVMLVAPDAVTLVDAMLELTGENEALADVPLRGGIATGPVLVREGDYYGPPVNLAARLTDLAQAWSLLADEALVELLDGPFEVRRIRPVRIRGVGLRRPLAVRSRQD